MNGNKGYPIWTTLCFICWEWKEGVGGGSEKYVTLQRSVWTPPPHHRNISEHPHYFTENAMCENTMSEISENNVAKNNREKDKKVYRCLFIVHIPYFTDFTLYLPDHAKHETLQGAQTLHCHWHIELIIIQCNLALFGYHLFTYLI